MSFEAYTSPLWLVLTDVPTSRLELRALAKSSPSDRKYGAAAIELERRRTALSKRIDAYYEKGTKLFNGLDVEILRLRSIKQQELCICEDPVNECNCEPETDGETDGEDEKEVEIEDVPIPLPSTASDLPARWKSEIAKEERLRVAQAHEALDSLRSHIAHKSYLYRGNKKLASGKRGRKTVYGQINTIESSMRLECKRYSLARAALLNLNVLHKHSELQELTNADTKAVITVWDPNARGQRDKGLSWI